jgi:hypothetical protein
LFPGLFVELQNPSNPAKSIQIPAELDSGAEYSLFEGKLAIAIGLDLFEGKPFAFELNNGISLDARVLPVVISHAELGRFELHARFSTGPIRRSILGRDFFDLLQVGFDEHHSEVYLSTARDSTISWKKRLDIGNHENYETKPNNRGNSGILIFQIVELYERTRRWPSHADRRALVPAPITTEYINEPKNSLKIKDFRFHFFASLRADRLARLDGRFAETKPKRSAIY